MAQPIPTAHAGYVPTLGTLTSTERHTYRAYRLLHWAFILAPILAGLDKFFHILVNWDIYLAPIVPQILHVPTHGFMLAVGVIEIIAGLIVAFKPKIGGYIVTIWLWGIIINLFLNPNHYYDIALRDFGLSLGALALAQLSQLRWGFEATSGETTP